MSEQEKIVCLAFASVICDLQEEIEQLTLKVQHRDAIVECTKKRYTPTLVVDQKPLFDQMVFIEFECGDLCNWSVGYYNEGGWFEIYDNAPKQVEVNPVRWMFIPDDFAATAQNP